MGRDFDSFRAILQPIKIWQISFPGTCFKTIKIHMFSADVVLGGRFRGFWGVARPANSASVTDVWPACGQRGKMEKVVEAGGDRENAAQHQ
jgi:hypothetical protein